jgi:hypothetical protein
MVKLKKYPRQILPPGGRNWQLIFFQIGLKMIAILKLGLKGLPMTNTLAYFMRVINVTKSVITGT